MTKKQKQFVEDMKRTRGINFARLGMMVEVEGDIGTITGMNHGANLEIVFANKLKYGTHKHSCHPTWKIKYFDEDGHLIRDFDGDINRQTA